MLVLLWCSLLESQVTNVVGPRTKSSFASNLICLHAVLLIGSRLVSMSTCPLSPCNRLHASAFSGDIVSALESVVVATVGEEVPPLTEP